MAERLGERMARVGAARPIEPLCALRAGDLCTPGKDRGGHTGRCGFCDGARTAGEEAPTLLPVFNTDASQGKIVEVLRRAIHSGISKSDDDGGLKDFGPIFLPGQGSVAPVRRKSGSTRASRVLGGE